MRDLWFDYLKMCRRVTSGFTELTIPEQLEELAAHDFSDRIALIRAKVLTAEVDKRLKEAEEIE